MGLRRDGAWRRWLGGCAGLLLCASWVPAQAGFSCTVMVAAGKPAHVLPLAAQGQGEELPWSAPDCGGARVVGGGRAVVCQPRPGKDPLCREFKSGQQIQAQGFEPDNASVLGQVALAVMELLGGTPGTAKLMSRGEGAREARLPQHKVLLLQPVIHVDFAQPPLAGARAVAWHADQPEGALLADVQPQAGSGAQVTTALFAPGRTYWWVPHFDSPSLMGPVAFTVASSDEREQARAALLRIQHGSAVGSSAKAWIAAEWLASHGYAFDAQQYLQAAGLLQSAAPPTGARP